MKSLCVYITREVSLESVTDHLSRVCIGMYLFWSLKFFVYGSTLGCRKSVVDLLEEKLPNFVGMLAFDSLQLSHLCGFF